MASTADESASTDANIKALEGLLDEFFRDVSNERKAEIERLLSEFSEQVIISDFPDLVEADMNFKNRYL